MTESSVRVGVRIRPLVSKERGQNVIIDSYDKDSIVFKGSTFTFDHVFGMELSQTDLYQNTAAPMLKNFLDGYNCTIMAYGQTGSGKTYTMGTSDINCQDIESQGLIPRFVNDLFENLNQPDEDSQGQQTTYKIKVSFLEIYGEDVFDLLSNSASSPRCAENRPSLPVREDENGHVFVQGQTEIDVRNALATLDVLSMGSHNRITASTAMNAGSSRSHAVFTLHLEQSIRSMNSEDVNTVTSKLTFVDLAGSERIKRTGAEGQRLKEGIQINSGLFNLGQVINSLADEQKLKHGTKSNFVPYRNSKLTHLLKDALGGNSQTLFLACISPAESNENESHSTLNYARQARNIKNKPVRNMDKSQLEMRKLRLLTKAWMMKALTLLFPVSSPSGSSTTGELPSQSTFQSPTRASAMKKVMSPGSATFEACRIQTSFSTTASSAVLEEEALLKRPEVLEFINAFNASIEEKLDLASPSPRKIRLSLGFAGYHHPTATGGLLRSPPIKTYNALQPHALTSVKKTLYATNPGLRSSQHNNTMDDIPSNPFEEIPAFPATTGFRRGRESVLVTAEVTEAIQAAHQLDDTEQLVERMMNMVNKEKKLLAGVHHHSSHTHSNTNTGGILPETDGNDETMLHDEEDEEEENQRTGSGSGGARSLSPLQASHPPSHTSSLDENEELLEVDRLIQEKEEILTKLMDNIKSYQAIKLEFEKLVDAISNLEKEKTDLEQELEKAKKTNTSSVQLEKMKERFQTIKEELKKMQQDKKNKESMYQLMQRESKHCEVMQREIQKLKEAKITLMKQQRSTTMALQKLKKENQVKLQSMKKSEIKKQQMVNSLKSELTKKERIIGHKDRELNRVTMKLKACEEHITQLLRLQNRQRNKIVNPATSNNVGAAVNSVSVANTTTTSKDKGLTAAKSFFAMEKYKILLENPDYEYYTTSKNLLEQVLMHQIEKKVMVVQYQKKALELKQLNEELLKETKQLESLQEMKREIVNENQVNPEDIKPLALVSEEIHYELENILQRIEYTENNIERISKEIDCYNSDLDDLSLRLEESNNKELVGAEPGSTNTSAVATAVNNWQHIGNEVISSLNLTQAQLFINELLNEKLSIVENAKLLEVSTSTTKTRYESLVEKYRDLDRLTQQMNQNYLNRMKNLEKQRISEIWTILKSSADPSSSQETTEASEIANNITLLRAKELEKELEVVSCSEQELRTTTREQQSLIADLEYQLQIIQNQLYAYQQLKNASTANTSDKEAVIPSEFLQEISHYWNEIGIEASQQQEKLQSVLQSQTIMQQKLLVESKQDYFVKQEEIQKLIQSMENILQFSGSSFSQFLQDYEAPGTASTSVVALIKKYRAVLVSSPQDFLKIKPQKDVISLLLHYVCAYCQHFYNEIYPQFHNMQSQGQSLVTEMMLQLQETAQNYSVQLSPVFIRFMQWKSPLPTTVWNTVKSIVASLEGKVNIETEGGEGNSWILEDKQKSVATELMKIISSFVSHQLVYQTTWKAFEQELKQLNLQRIQMTNKIITLRDQILVLANDALSLSSEEFTSLAQSILQTNLMQMFTQSQLPKITDTDKTTENTSPLLDNLSLEKIYQLSLQILAKKTLSNPPGSESIVVYLEKLLLLLESTKCNRINLSQSLVDLIQSWIDYYQLEHNSSTAMMTNTPSMNSILQRVVTFTAVGENEEAISLLQLLRKIPSASERSHLSITSPQMMIFYQKSFIQQLFSVLQEMIEKKWKDLYHYQFERLVGFMKIFKNVSAVGISEGTATTSTNMQLLMTCPDLTSSISHIHAVCKQLLQAYHSRPPTAHEDGDDDEENHNRCALYPHAKLIDQFTEFFEECSNLIVFMEENWIQTSLMSIVSYWQQSCHHTSYYAEIAPTSISDGTTIRYSLKEIMYQTSFFYQEGIRFQGIYEAFLELKKQDGNLVQHIQEFEEFETNSHKDRAKILTGNSKLLIEEEKYRKQAKKRYEMISEKIVQLFQKLITLTTTTTTANALEATTGKVGTSPVAGSSPMEGPVAATPTPIMIECKIDLNCFSQYTQNIVKNGIQKERLELIRLHTSAAAMFGGVTTTNTTTSSTSTTTTASNTSTTNATSVTTTAATTTASTAGTTGKKEGGTLTRIPSKPGNSLYAKNKERVTNTNTATSTTTNKAKAASKSNTNNNAKETKEGNNHTDSHHSHAHHLSKASKTTTNTTTASSSHRQSLSGNHNFHRLSINARLSISTAEPGLINPNNNGNNNSTNYSFQPPTPPTREGMEENNPNHLNILTGIPLNNSPMMVSKNPFAPTLSATATTSSPLKECHYPATVLDAEEEDDLFLTSGDLQIIDNAEDL